ncbi:MAG TPA: hypothetical protein VGM35_03540 [Xanthobacteraceae bacterium]
MDLTVFERLISRTPATLDEIRLRVSHALGRHPLCRDVKFEIVPTPRSAAGGNWTITLQSVGPDAIQEASEIVADIQEAYDVALAA